MSSTSQVARLGPPIGLAIGFAAAGAATRIVAIRVTPGEVANRPFADATRCPDRRVAARARLDVPEAVRGRPCLRAS